jgi:hypothetical protein
MTMIGSAAAANIAVMPTIPKKPDTAASDTAETSAAKVKVLLCAGDSVAAPLKYAHHGLLCSCAAARAMSRQNGGNAIIATPTLQRSAKVSRADVT